MLYLSLLVSFFAFFVIWIFRLSLKCEYTLKFHQMYHMEDCIMMILYTYTTLLQIHIILSCFTKVNCCLYRVKLLHNTLYNSFATYVPISFHCTTRFFIEKRRAKNSRVRLFHFLYVRNDTKVIVQINVHTILHCKTVHYQRQTDIWKRLKYEQLFWYFLFLLTFSRLRITVKFYP